MQKELLQMWDELPLAAAATASIARFAGAYAAGGERIRHTISRAKSRKAH